MKSPSPTNVSRWCLVTAGTALVAASCGVPMRGGSYFEPQADVEPYTTFAFDQHMDTGAGDDRLTETRFFENRLHEAIERELSWRGINLEESSPDILVHHHTSIQDHVFVREAVEESGEEVTEVYEFEEGTVVVHLVDARTRESIWVGWAQAEIEPAFRSPGAMTEWVDRLVATMFQRWPGPAQSRDDSDE